MEVQPDFRELLALFLEHEVEFVIVGAYALAFHGAPRFTGDMDLLVRPERENAERVVAALTDFGFGSAGLAAADFVEAGQVVQLGVPPVRVDILTSISGVPWDEAAEGAEAGAFGGLEVPFLGREEYVANKRSLDRAKDRADLEALGEE